MYEEAPDLVFQDPPVFAFTITTKKELSSYEIGFFVYSGSYTLEGKLYQDRDFGDFGHFFSQ